MQQDTTAKLSEHIRRLTDIGLALSAKGKADHVFDLVLEEALQYTNADGATIYMVDQQGQNLDFKVVFNRTLNLRMGGSHGQVTWPPLPLYEPETAPRLRHMVTWVVHNAKSAVVEDMYAQTLFDASGTKEMDKKNDYRSQSAAAVPFIDHEGKVLGVIQLINAMDDNNRVIPFSEEHIKMLESLAGQTAISISNRRLIKSLQNLLQQFARSIANAIDHKSRHTGGHLTRVAKLTDMLAEAVQNQQEGHFAKIKFSHDELAELSMAAWLHDVGKIITPQHVLDKSTKLETIVDRIELIRTRFALVDKSIECDLTCAMYQGEKPRERELNKLRQQLAEDLELVERLNAGSEYLNPPDHVELTRIANFTYPAKPKDLFLLTPDEYANLAIQKGTLTDKEIAVIREHASVTWQMLSELSFPQKLSNVPLYASSHHEKLNGRGYPRLLNSGQLPLQSRLIAVADIFEALTSSDRPYKKAKPLSEALRILAFMVKDNDLDADVVDLLLNTNLWQEYAEQYLKSEQIDHVDLEKIKSVYHKS